MTNRDYPVHTLVHRVAGRLGKGQIVKPRPDSHRPCSGGDNIDCLAVESGAESVLGVGS